LRKRVPNFVCRPSSSPGEPHMRSEIHDKASEMRSASLDEASQLLRAIAGNRHADESLKAMFRRLSRTLPNWSPNRITDIWRRDVRVRIHAEEIQELRAIVDRRRGTGTTTDELAELRSTVQRLAKYEALLERIDAEFFGPQISATRDQISEASSVLGAGRVRIRP
jgi:hypothetical protein